MAVLRDSIGSNGLFTDGDWILSKNMDVDGEYGVIQLKHVGVGEFLDKDFKFITREKFTELKCTEVLPGDVLIGLPPQYVPVIMLDWFAEFEKVVPQ